MSPVKAALKGVTKALTWAETMALKYKVWEIPADSNVTRIWVWYHQLTGAPAYQRSPYCGAGGICVDYHAESSWKPPSNWISVYAIQAWGEAHNRWHRGSAGIKPGDALVLLGPGVHTGRARSATHSDGSVDTWEANTSPGAEGSQFDGGTVALKTRTVGEVYGYVVTHDLLGGGRAPVVLAGDNHKPSPQYRKEPATGNLTIWETGPRVERLQLALGIHGDGYYGRSTAAAVRRHKKAHGYNKPNGHVAGPRIRRELATAAPPPRRRKTLHPGDKGGQVRQLQQQLIHHKLMPAKTAGWRNDDGDYGPHTTAAVNRLRKHHGWKQSGVAGHRVWEELES